MITSQIVSKIASKEKTKKILATGLSDRIDEHWLKLSFLHLQPQESEL